VQQGALTRAIRVAWVVLGLLALVLLVTGVWLWFEYRPVVPAAWDPVLGERQPMRDVHRVASSVALTVATVQGGLLVVRRWRRWPLALLVVIPTAVAAFTGELVAWDQLSLFAVTVGENVRGLRAVFDDGVKFVLVDGTEVSVTTFRRWAVVHVALLPVAAAVAAAVAYLRARRSVQAPDGSS
jgi:quinol-cytochrome oxidoreductase complex cytochrome b subunit